MMTNVVKITNLNGKNSHLFSDNLDKMILYKNETAIMRVIQHEPGNIVLVHISTINGKNFFVRFKLSVISLLN